MEDEREPHHPAIDAILAANLSEHDLHLLGSAWLATSGKIQAGQHTGLRARGVRLEPWCGAEFVRSLQYFATGIDPDEPSTSGH